MILLNKHNFSVFRFHRDPGSPASPNDKFYSDIKICLVLDGQAVWEIEGHPLQVQTGDVVFLNIGQKRRFLSFGAQGLELCIFNLTRSAFSNLHHLIFFRDCAKKNILQHPALSRILMETFQFWNSGSHLRYEWASAKFTEFFIQAELLENFTLDAISLKNMEMLGRMDQIDEGIAKGFPLREIAGAAGLSESAFSRRFAAATGINFKQYAMEKKVQRALQLLKNTDLKIIDICAECGFQSVSGFYDTFRKLLGTTPNKIRSEP